MITPDREAALQRVGGDEAALTELVTVYLRNCPVMLGEIRAAVSAASPGDLAAAAHKLKGASGFVGAAAIVDLAGQLEIMARRDELVDAELTVSRLGEAIAVAQRELERWLR